MSKVAIYADDTTLYGTCSNAYNLWSQLEMTGKLEAELETPRVLSNGVKNGMCLLTTEKHSLFL